MCGSNLRDVDPSNSLQNARKHWTSNFELQILKRAQMQQCVPYKLIEGWRSKLHDLNFLIIFGSFDVFAANHSGFSFSILVFSAEHRNARASRRLMKFDGVFKTFDLNQFEEFSKSSRVIGGRVDGAISLELWSAKFSTRTSHWQASRTRNKKLQKISNKNFQLTAEDPLTSFFVVWKSFEFF